MGWCRKTFNLVWSRRLDRDIERELSFHIAERAEDLAGSGVPEDEARRKALRQFGNYGLYKERTRDMGIHTWVEAIAKDVRYSLRGLWKKPAFTSITVITIGLGIAATTAIFSVVNGILIKPLPYPEPESLVAVWHSGVIQGTRFEKMNLSAPMYFAYREASQTFQNFGIWNGGFASVTGLGDPEQVPILSVTYEILPTLGVTSFLGRGFSSADDSPGRPQTVILTYAYWQRRFGGDKSAIGRLLTIDSRPREIIGVMPPTFRFLNNAPQMILPLQLDRAQANNDAFNYLGIARLKPKVTLAQANCDVGRMLPIWASFFGGSRNMLESTKMAPALRPLKQDVVGDIAKSLWVVMGTVAIVLLIACANVANLSLVRTAARHQELAVRAALGAGWARIARELLIDSLILALAGGALGLSLAYAGLRLLLKIGPTNLPRLTEISIDPLVLLFALAISLASGVLFGLAPVLNYAIPHIGALGGARTATLSRERQRFQNGLAVVQITLALVLLVCSGLMIRSFDAIRSVEPGFTVPEQIQMFRISIPAAQVAEPERMVRLQNDILDKVAAIAGVTSAAFATGMPMERPQSNSAVWIEGHTSDGQVPPIRRTKVISPGLFKTQGTPIVAGHDFTWSDVYESHRVAIVSENMAREVWGGTAAALGKRIDVGRSGQWYEIIGVAGDLYDNGVQEKPPAIVYSHASLERYLARNVTFAVRSNRTGTEGLLNEIRAAVWSVNPNLPLAQVRSLAEVYGQSMARTSFTLTMLAIAGLMALALGIVGIYGVISYTVSQRRREIGIRLALGAQQQAVRRRFVQQGFALTCAGVAAGLVMAIPLTQLISPLLFRIRPLDAGSYLASVVLLIVAAALASYIPARRASSVDPVEALRVE
jgi:predicted permease